MLRHLLIFAFFAAACLAQDYEEYRPASRPAPSQLRYSQQAEEPKQEPIAILKQINRHNEDGSYTYGYEGADGSFKIETKTTNGEVKGKYGYVDGDGKVRTVEYGANKFGFQPSGEGITVPPLNFNEEPEKEVDYEDLPQQFIARPKQQQSKLSRPQPNYDSRPVVEQKQYQPIAQTQAPAPQYQYYDYEEEVQTPRPVAQAPRPKYTASPVPQRAQSQPQQQQQFPNSIDIVYADPRPSKPVQQHRFDERQPAIFPSEPSRADQFSLFSPAPRADVYKPKPQQYAQEPIQYAPQPAAPRPSFAAARPAQQQQRGHSVLDQLAKDYALPQGSTALHDISFGYSL